jgi:hypothetical protein
MKVLYVHVQKCHDETPYYLQLIHANNIFD